MYLETKPDYDQCVERVQAWFDGEINVFKTHEKT